MITNCGQPWLWEIIRVTGKPIPSVAELSGVSASTLYAINAARTQPNDKALERLIICYCRVIINPHFSPEDYSLPYSCSQDVVENVSVSAARRNYYKGMQYLRIFR